ncbi:MAG: hypothetical protein IJO65_09415 [Lachnospiraceae bacterium]|nr:hypothetical protein [Lachnospiraceae bacterium]
MASKKQHKKSPAPKPAKKYVKLFEKERNWHSAVHTQPHSLAGSDDEFGHFGHYSI